MLRLLRTLALVVTGGIGLAGCFSDIPTAGLRNCPTGGNTCRCEDGDACDPGLECEEDGFCRSPRCVDGEQSCACGPGAMCDVGLECVDGSCLPINEPSTSGATVPPPSSDASSSAGATDSTTAATSGVTIDPSMSEVGPGGPGTDPTIDPTTDLTSTGMSAEVGEVGEVGTGGMLRPECACGWLVLDGTNAYWDCVEGEPMPDPMGSDPACPESVTEADVLIVDGGGVAACDFGSAEANLRGCCYGGMSVWCSTGSLVVTRCMTMDPTCFPDDP